MIIYATDLARAHAIAIRMKDAENDSRSQAVLEGALLADYSRPFISHDGSNPAIYLQNLNTDFCNDEFHLHDQLIQLASAKAEQLRDGKGFDELVADQLLGGLNLSTVIDLIFKVRKAVTIALYPELEIDPEKLDLMFGLLRCAE